MSLRHRPLPSLLAALFVAGILSQAASCTLDAYGTKPPVTSQPCTSDDVCNDENPCTSDVCGANKTCTNTAVPDGIAPTQIAGDCKRATCKDGAIDEETPDDEDLPNDLESCTTDSCSNGNAVHMPLEDEAPCALGPSAGLCESGKCTVECGAEKPCNDGNPCTEDTCNASTGRCTFSELDGLPTPQYTPVDGDCVQRICVAGVDTPVPDNADLPNDDNSCTKEKCVDGKPEVTSIGEGLACVAGGIPGTCDAVGTCKQCTVASDCSLLPPDNGCRTRTCINNVCGQTFEPTGTTIASTAGDCKKNVCDGAGNITQQNDDTDLPSDDNTCTKDSCVAGVPTFVADPTKNGLSCGPGAAVCNAMGQCTGCTTASDCAGTDDFCKTRTCTSNQCGYSYKPVGTVVDSGQTSNDCKVIQCDGMGNKVTVVDPNDFIVDGNQCTIDSCSAMGEPQNPFSPLNADCNQNGGTKCNGFGICLDPNGTTCADGTECISGFCTDGVCCNSTCPDGCMACNVPGSVGTCKNVFAGQDDLPSCSGNNSCDGAGTCKRDNGQACGNNVDCSSGFCVDGYCCNTACNDSCKSCNVTGSIGVCTFVPAYTYDSSGTPACTHPFACDGKGVCKGFSPAPCMKASDCLFGACYDGFCCNVFCDGLCKACSQAKTGNSDGTCGNILPNTDPNNECPSGECSGGGACTGAPPNLPIGSACTAPGACASGYCVDGVCCPGACANKCTTCNLAGAPGVCNNVPAGQTDPDSGCSGGFECNGSGACRAPNGSGCTAAGDCLSGFCNDGYCCNAACTDACKSCSGDFTGMANGTCNPVTNGTDPFDDCPGAGLCLNGSCSP